MNPECRRSDGRKLMDELFKQNCFYNLNASSQVPKNEIDASMIEERLQMFNWKNINV